MYPRSFFIILSAFFGTLSILSAMKSRSNYRNHKIYEKSRYETTADILEYSEYSEDRKKYSRLRIKYYNGENNTENILIIKRKKGIKYKNSASCQVVCIKGRKSIIDILNNDVFNNKFLNEGFTETINNGKKLLYNSNRNDGSVYLKEDAQFLRSAFFYAFCSIISTVLALIMFILYFEFIK